jgi:hypothetical protein
MHVESFEEEDVGGESCAEDLESSTLPLLFLNLT